MEMAQLRERTRTRPRAALAMEAAVTSPKRRKIIINNNNASQDLESLSTSSSGGSLVPQERCSSPSSDESPASCCSSNGFLSLDEKIIKFSDLEVVSARVETSCDCGDQIIRREMSLSSELGTKSKEVEKKKPTKQITQPQCILSTPQKMPTESELEEFFAAAEKDIQKQFSNKYNYDIVKDLPLEGRYEWVQLKP